MRYKYMGLRTVSSKSSKGPPIAFFVYPLSLRVSRNLEKFDRKMGKEELGLWTWNRGNQE